MGIDGSSTMNSPIFCSQTSFSVIFGEPRSQHGKSTNVVGKRHLPWPQFSPITENFHLCFIQFMVLATILSCGWLECGCFKAVWEFFLYFLCSRPVSSISQKKRGFVVLLCFALIVFLLGIGWACTCSLVALPFFHKCSFHFKGRR